LWITIYKSCYVYYFPTIPITEAPKMSEEIWHGIPRNKIPWYPTIDYAKCVSCGKCVDYCKLGAYEFEEKAGKKRVVVKNPFNCVVLCTGCDAECPQSAISHPSKTETREAIKKLRTKS
jgi:NAD-dependent dihydropyrimidine dehydrogenase PreA subunit